jgi:hypothetical protein
MSLTQIAVLLTRAAEGADEESISPWFVGGGILAILLLILLALLAFGGGREHS